MKKRICAFLCVLLMLVSFSCSVSALIMVEDESGTRYSDESMNPTTTQPSAISVATKKALSSMSNFWRRYGFVTVVILLLVSIVVAIVISEFERQKKEKAKHAPEPAHNKKKKK